MEAIKPGSYQLKALEKQGCDLYIEYRSAHLAQYHLTKAFWMCAIASPDVGAYTSKSAYPGANLIGEPNCELTRNPHWKSITQEIFPRVRIANVDRTKINPLAEIVRNFGSYKKLNLHTENSQHEIIIIYSRESSAWQCLNYLEGCTEYSRDGSCLELSVGQYEANLSRFFIPENAFEAYLKAFDNGIPEKINHQDKTDEEVHNIFRYKRTVKLVFSDEKWISHIDPGKTWLVV
mmetsp:Transcript_36344/g.41421  ORF Transcript_36344/g.41421 Transcript_36344/m.41421 type:complete len:234 (+) Transcript_36344:36-737(+)